jgi:arginase
MLTVMTSTHGKWEPDPVFVLPWHIFDDLQDGLNVTLGGDVVTVRAQPAAAGADWARLVPLYEPVAAAVAASPGTPLVLCGDCITPLAVLAGLQRSGVDAALVWFDAHGDFHTEATTQSGYLGGLPLAKAVGRGDMTLPSGLGLEPIAETRAVLVDGRDLDPPEVEALASSAVRRVSLGDIVAAVPDGPIHLHVDLDVLDPSILPGLRFPALGGADLTMLARAVGDVSRRRELVAVSIAATWRPEATERARNDAAVAAVLDALTQTGLG